MWHGVTEQAEGPQAGRNFMPENMNAALQKLYKNLIGIDLGLDVVTSQLADLERVISAEQQQPPADRVGQRKGDNPRESDIIEREAKQVLH